MKTFQTFVGIDISKLSLDLSVIDQQAPNKAVHYKMSNDSKGIDKLLNQLGKSGIVMEATLFVCENTGIYTTPLMTSLSSQKLHYWVVAAIEIKRSQGLIRVKSDRADAKMIALYGLSHQHKY